MKIVYVILFFLFLFSLKALSQKGNKTPSHYWEPEYSLGPILPSHSEFPETKGQQSFFLTYGKVQTDTSKNWIANLNFPETGISMAYSDYGNEAIFGHSYSIIPQIVFKGSKRLYNSSHFKLGLGGSYFTRKYEWPDNITNNSVGSHYMWTFRAAYYYNFKVANRVLLNIGCSYIHSSNSHVQLPNFGMNAVMLNVSAQIFTAKDVELSKTPLEKPQLTRTKSYFISMYAGTGWHELGDAAAPKFTPKKRVNSIAIFGSKVYNNCFRFKAGATYRFYQSYYDYIVEHETEPFIQHPVSAASNLYISVGGELLMGHFGTELEIGFNVFKPFYPTFSDIFEKHASGIGNTLKEFIPIRFGLKAYAISNEKAPKNNVFIATHINANMGAADFMSVTFGFVRKLPY